MNFFLEVWIIMAQWPKKKKNSLGKKKKLSHYSPKINIFPLVDENRTVNLFLSLQVEFCKKKVNENIFLRLSLIVGSSAEDTYRKLADYKSRKKWDFMCK